MSLKILLKKQTGLGIIDIILGLFIGLIVVFSAYSTLLFFQTSDRTTIAGNSAVENGISAIFALEHDLKEAGLGFLTGGSITCSTLYASYGGVTYASGSAVAPVTITNNGSGLSDSLVIQYQNNVLAAAPALASAFTISSATMIVNSAITLQTGQPAIISSSAGNVPCTIVKVSAIVNSLNSAVVTFDAGSSPNTSYAANTWVANGNGFTSTTWSINTANSTLQMLDNTSTSATAIAVADNIVQLQAQYGIAGSITSYDIQNWVDATGTYATLNSSNIALIRAVRVAVVARSAQPEKPATPGGACTTTTTAPTIWTWPIATTAVLTANSNWQCYRYKVFTTVVPLMNIVMKGAS